MQCNKTSLTYQADSEWTQAKLSVPGGRLCSEGKLVSGDRWSQANLTSDRRSQATLFWQVTGEAKPFNIFRLCWYGFFVRLALWSVLLPLWHKHPVTTRWRGQPGHGKAWLGKGAVKLTDGEVIRGAWVIGSKNRMWLMQFSQGVVQCQKRLADVLGPINRKPSSHSLQLPGWITAVWIRRMESHYVRCECDTSFRAHTEIHGQETG